ncbi:MAG: hypothetical protein MJ182_08040 [Treponema sp.]|nr:hypothetical protein [Treponema sp.]
MKEKSKSPEKNEIRPWLLNLENDPEKAYRVSKIIFKSKSKLNNNPKCINQALANYFRRTDPDKS